LQGFSDLFRLVGSKQADFNDNLLTDIENGTLSGARSAITIFLKWSNINKIQVELLNSLANLQYLKLNNNQIKIVDPMAFNGLRSLKSPDLSDNLIKNVDRRTLIELANLDSLYMFGNLIHSPSHSVTKSQSALSSKPSFVCHTIPVCGE